MYHVMIFVLAAWVVFSVYIALYAEDPKSPAVLRKLGCPFYYAAGMVFLIVYLRWPGVAWQGWLDPDESTTIGQAIRAVAEPVPWLGFDSSTSGPLNSWFVALVAGWSKPITLLDARLGGLICWVGSWLACYWAARLWFGEAAARVGLGLTGLFVALATQSGFVHFSSEQLPMFFLCAGWGLFATATVVPSWRWQRLICWLTILELTLVPLAKPQGGPIAVGLALWVLVWGSRQAHLRGASVMGFLSVGVVSGLLLPAGLFVWVCAEGGFDPMYQQFILWNFQYTGGFIAGPATGADWARGFAIMQAYAGEFAAYFAGTGIAVVLLLVRGASEDGHVIRFCWRSWWVILFGGCSFVCIMMANKGFTHYLCFMVFPVGAILVMVAGAVCTGTGVVANARVPLWRLFVLGVFVSGMLPLLHLSLSRDNLYLKIGGGRYVGMPELIDRAIMEAKPNPEDRIAIWGWVPEVFVLSQLTPATPYISGQPCSPQACSVQQWYRDSFRRGIERERPRFFLDAVAPGAQGYGYLLSEPHEADPALACFIDGNYRVVAKIKGDDSDREVRLYEIVAP